MPFEDVWAHILREHPAVRSNPVKIVDGDHSWFEIGLATGGYLVYEPPIGYWLIGQLDLERRARIAASSPPGHTRGRRYRHKAEELRTFAETMTSDARAPVLRLAGTYDELADRVERVARSRAG